MSKDHEAPLTHDDCLDGPYNCVGRVDYRMAMSPTGISYPRCEGHYDDRLVQQERISRDYGVPMTYDSPSTWASEWADEAYDY